VIEDHPFRFTLPDASPRSRILILGRDGGLGIFSVYAGEGLRYVLRWAAVVFPDGLLFVLK
jgi:hypothetical protein